MTSILPNLLWLAAAMMPSIGQKAPDFELDSYRGGRVRLSAVTAKSPVALVVLRGYPGYQCPMCQRQVADFLARAPAFASAGVRVIFVYPGPPERASEFVTGKNMPPDFEMLLDPDYEFTNLYGLRWEAKNETAYPSTFLIRQDGIVYFIKSAMLHGGRTTASEIIELLPKGKK